MIVVTAMPVEDAKASTITTKIFFMTPALLSDTGSMPEPARRTVIAVTEQSFPAVAMRPLSGPPAELTCCCCWYSFEPAGGGFVAGSPLAYVHSRPAIIERLIAYKTDRDAGRHPRNRAATRPDDQVGAGGALAGIGKRMSG